MKEIYIISLALNQTKFWSKIIKKTKKKNIKIITFDDESSNYLYSKNILMDASKEIKKKKYNYSLNQLVKKFKFYDINNFDRLMNHEYIFFGKRDKIKILNNFLKTFEFFEENFKKKKNIIFIQEIGGFIPNISAYVYSKNKKLNHYFLETSFFQNHFHILKNTIKCNPVYNSQKKNINIKKYLSMIKKLKKINIPKKDISHFQTPYKKILNFYNFLRFFEKKFKQIFLGYNFIFAFDFKILKNIISNFFNHQNLKGYYLSLEELKKINFAYYPMHVPNDFALTIRSFKYQDQISLIKTIANKIYPKKILIKEHPARIGSLNINDFNKMISKNKNILIADPKINNFELLGKCDFLITINSKAGFEAMVFNKPIISFGESFYKKSKLINFLKEPKNIKKTYTFKKKIYTELRNSFFQKFSNYIFKGQLYITKKNNINEFTKSIKQIL